MTPPIPQHHLDHPERKTGRNRKQRQPEPIRVAELTHEHDGAKPQQQRAAGDNTAASRASDLRSGNNKRQNP